MLATTQRDGTMKEDPVSPLRARSGNILRGTYDANRLANLSLGFLAYDAGAGYTYRRAATNSLSSKAWPTA